MGAYVNFIGKTHLWKTSILASLNQRQKFGRCLARKLYFSDLPSTGKNSTMTRKL
ncbi:hypothetical protein [Okeania sp. KiyG1]|uniref:hypothetical protein n=1 Tax=Okeania sp. KiyG1 TaxID=2720165 RepID=UPI001922BB80|nr:hypothetical protein [Okeania sp. KiyG1]